MKLHASDGATTVSSVDALHIFVERVVLGSCGDSRKNQARSIVSDGFSVLFDRPVIGIAA